MNAFEKKDLIRLINEPLDSQYDRILAKIMEAVSISQGDILICFSGGKDSALMLDMYCSVIQMFDKTSTPVQVAWANTTNETNAMKEYIPGFIKRCEDKYGVSIDFTEVKPSKGQTAISVFKSEGIPFISKSVSSLLRKVTADMNAHNVTYDDIKNLHKPTIQCRDMLREMGLSNTTVLAFTGWSCRRNDFGKEFILPFQRLPLLDISRVTGKDIRFSEKCCQILKKDPVSRMKHKNIMTGEQAVESKSRESAWLKTGCNFTEYIKGEYSIRSKPLGSVSLNAILFAINYREIPICIDYGEIIYDEIKCSYRCTKASRTGCALCGFGIKFDPDRFIRLQQDEPAKIALAFKPIEQGGLGYKEICEYTNFYCKTKIQIPEV